MPSQLFDTLMVAALAIWVYMSVWFLVALAAKRNDVADIAWGLGFVVASVVALIRTGNHSLTANLVTILVTVWGLRLSWHIALRNSKKLEDYRYKAWRDSRGRWFGVRTYLQIFMLQGLLLLLILTPVLIIYTYSMSGRSNLVTIGVALWIFGFAFESIGDRQLKNFIADPANKGRVMSDGLWKFTRHPNYFGEVTQWWAIGIIALTCSYGWMGLIGPVVITYLIINVSGIPLLEKKYEGNTEYQQYQRRTSRLFPLPSKK